ncbi:HNH endonuclease signature motif containing protein [Bacillus sp. JJ1474]|uniref:HNH endonuclease signature motif containing protein n=1 Tax=Bacillus sp. JJ1474 TaxID=3122955 RepID=UPI003000A8C8
MKNKQQYKTKEQKKKFYNSTQWLRLRQLVLQRDNYECVWCKREGKVTTQDRATLEIDHIKELETHPKLALEIINMRTLCKYHHNVRHDRFDGKVTREGKWNDERWD